MAEPFVKSSFASGELAPSLYGRIDLQKWSAGCSVARNVIVDYKGGLASRAGTEFVGACKQSASGNAPRIINFKFNLFQSYILEFGDNYMRVATNGSYVTESPQNITAVTNANPCQVTIPNHGFLNGDWVYVIGVTGMINLNGRTFIVAGATVNTFNLTDIFGTPVNSLTYPAFGGGGTAARIYTLTTPYAAVDLPYLKFTQSADTMSLTCVNQETLTDYPPYELQRLAANNWTLTQATFAAPIGPPTAVSATPSGSTGSNPVAYSYVVTAVDSVTGGESIASNIVSATGSVNISTTFGTITVVWTAPAAGTVSQYNIYKCPPSYTNSPQSGQFFGYVGSTAGTATTWQDDNVLPDYTVTPPLHTNPFPSTGNYPGVVAYFQQRRVYANTLNAPDTYEMSQPGSYSNFDSAIPPVDSDAITGTPWASQVNGLQWMLPMPGGLIIGTGEDAWQVSGTGGAGSAITPAQQNAQPQESNGFNPILQPIKINFDIIYGQSLGSIIRDLQYNFFTNIYAGTDITVLSSHLFLNYSISSWAWAREPYKVIWCVRNDGKMLSLTFLKEQEVIGWTRHDTNGLAMSVATASEPPVDAVYFVMKRYIPGPGQWMYYLERMNNRLWANVEQCWCVDCGLSLPQPAPNATLQASSATPPRGIAGGSIVLGGSGYVAPVGTVIDQQGNGSGGTVSLTQVGGVITGITVLTAGQDYVAPVLQIQDSAGSGAEIVLSVDFAVTFTASASVFTSASVGSVIRMGGGIAGITRFISSTQVIADLTKSITSTIPNDPNNLPIPAPSGNWTMTAPIASVSGLDHLEGMQVSVLADGSVAASPDNPLTVTGGSITLPSAASQITVGLPFAAQMQTLHAAVPGKEIQGKRKKINSVTLRLAQTRGIRVGQDQPIAAQQENQAEMPWGAPFGYLPLTEMIDRRIGLTEANEINAGSAVPLFSGDIFVNIQSDWNTPDGQRSPAMVAVQQTYPLPFTVLLASPDMNVGDTAG